MKTLLAVDDRSDDLLLLEYACRKSQANFTLRTANDGLKAIEYLESFQEGTANTCPPPDFLLLDLKMPKKTGFEVLSWIRNQSAVKDLKIAIFTSSQNEQDIQNAYASGANWYLMKPVAYGDLVNIVTGIEKYLTTGDTSGLTENSCYKPPFPTE